MSVTLHGPDGAGDKRQDEPQAPRPETPSERIINAANGLEYVTDSNGRRIGFKRLSMMDSWDLEALAGAQLAANEAWMSKAMMAFAVCEIDGRRVPRPNTQKELRALFQRLGDPGMVAMLVHLSSAASDIAKKAEASRMAAFTEDGEPGEAPGPREGEDMDAAKN